MPTTRLKGRAFAGRMLPTVLLCGFMYCGTLAADADPPRSAEQVHHVSAVLRQLEVRDADSFLLEYPDWLTRVDGFDPQLVRVTAVKPNRLRITRRANGKTLVKAIDRKKTEYTIELTMVSSGGEAN
jgi:hypothetical protein